MAINVTSHNQSGGITAGNVKVGQSLSPGKPPERRKLWAMIVAIVMVLAAVATILGYLGLKPWWEGTEVSDSKNIFNATSFNQSGGITAGQVIVGPQPRRLNDGLRGQLRSALPHDKKVTVVAVMGDGEAFQFASEIKQFLEGETYNVSGVDQAVYSGPVVGQRIQPRDDGLEVIIGTRQG